jgi:hypothetical protein
VVTGCAEAKVGIARDVQRQLALMAVTNASDGIAPAAVS